MSSGIWLELLDYARWSASPHNVQPWKVKVLSDKQADIYYLPERLLPVEDPTGCFNTVGLGMLIENLSIAAAKYQLQIKQLDQPAAFNAKATTPQRFIGLELVKQDRAELLDRELIKRRHTSRIAYDGRLVDRELLQKLSLLAREFEQSFVCSQDPALVEWVLKLNRDTIFYDMEDGAARNEIGDWLRYSTYQAQNKADGLWAYCMGFPGWLLSAFFHHHRLFYLPIIHSLVKASYLRTTNGTRTIGWLSGPFVTPSDWLKAGRMLARLWLTMTENDLYLHPFGSIITNPQSHKRLAEKFLHVEGQSSMWLLMRLGYSTPPPHSLRLPVEALLLD
jgi:hypothetical protein